MNPWPNEADGKQILAEATECEDDSSAAAWTAANARKLLARVRELEKREAELTAACKDALPYIQNAERCESSADDGNGIRLQHLRRTLLALEKGTHEQAR